jgi:hypothetical protein
VQERPADKRTAVRVITEQPPPGGDPSYHGRLLDQHKHFVEMTMRYWNHIETANHFFLSLHTVILSGFIYLLTTAARIPAPVLALLVAVACAMSLQWLMVLRSLRRLNQVRHEIIQEWEEGLAARPYKVEYEKLYGGNEPRSERYFRVQRLYMLVPVLALAAYLVIGLLIATGVRIQD